MDVDRLQWWYAHPILRGIRRVSVGFLVVMLVSNSLTYIPLGPSLARGFGLISMAACWLFLLFDPPEAFAKRAALVAGAVFGMALFAAGIGFGLLGSLAMGAAGAVLLIGVPAAWRRLWARWRAGKSGTHWETGDPMRGVSER